MTKFWESIKTNIVTWLIILMAGGLFVTAQTNNQKAVKVATVVKKEVDSLKQVQINNRRDIDTVLRTLPEMHKTIDVVKTDVAEIKGMLKILVELERNK